MKIRFYHARILTMKEKEAVFEGEVHIKMTGSFMLELPKMHQKIAGTVKLMQTEIF